MELELKIGDKGYDSLGRLVHIRGFVDDRVVYRVWNRHLQAWIYTCDPLELFVNEENQMYTKMKRG